MNQPLWKQQGFPGRMVMAVLFVLTIALFTAGILHMNKQSTSLPDLKSEYEVVFPMGWVPVGCDPVPSTANFCRWVCQTPQGDYLTCTPERIRLDNGS